ncbi:MAG TPA: hypothetical protein VMT35_00210 [Ignavibacteriaceae bacterium]|nr:hypothetical protein [Ignavibacteriaceae bacterium]
MSWSVWCRISLSLYRILLHVEALFRRGLIKPINSLFARFIIEANHPEDEFWKEQVLKSGWDMFRIPILLILTGIVIDFNSLEPIVTVLILLY